MLAAKGAEVLGLAIHELATNAIKYGVLAGEKGGPAIKWSLQQEKGQTWLKLDWTGIGIEPKPNTRRGFGTELVTGRVPYELKGRGSLVIAEAGAIATIEFPLLPGQSILQTDAIGLDPRDSGA